MSLTLRQILKEKREKEINEMAEIIENAFKVYFGANDLVEPEDFPYQAKDLAKELLEHYQPKLPEDSVVLSREEYERLNTFRVFIKPRELNQKELAEKLKNENYGIIGVDESSIEIIPTRAEIEKETAKKILFKFESAFAYYDNEDMFSKKAIFECLEEIAKQFGVEIKE